MLLSSSSLVPRTTSGGFAGALQANIEMVTSDVHDASFDAQHKESKINNPFATTNAVAEPTDWDTLTRIDDLKKGVVLPCVGTRKMGVLATAAGEESEDNDEEESAIHFLEMQDIDPSAALQHKPENITLHEYLAYLTRLNEDELEEVLMTGQTPTNHFAIAGAEYDPSEAFEVDIILVGAEDDACVDEVMQRVPEGCTPLEFVRDFVELSQAERDSIKQ